MKIDKKYKVFLINLDGSDERLENSRYLLESENIEFERVSAVNGAELSDQTINNIYQYQNGKHYYKELAPGELGCYLSHRKIWKKIIEQKLDFAIILEDDFSACDGLSEVIDTLKDFPFDWDYIKLAEHSRKRKPTFKWQYKNIQLCTFDKVPARTLAQAVTIQGATKLLNDSQMIKRPIDIDLQYWWEKKISVLGVLPPPVTPNMEVKSEIDKLGRNKQVKTNRINQMLGQISFGINNRRNANKQITEIKKKLDAR